MGQRSEVLKYISVWKITDFYWIIDFYAAVAYLTTSGLILMKFTVIRKEGRGELLNSAVRYYYK